MKKSFKLLPLVLAVPLLVGCGTKKVSEPKFAEFGEKKSADDFADAIEKAIESAVFSKEDKIGSFAMKETGGFEKVRTITRGKNAIYDYKKTSSHESETKYSPSSKLLAATETETSSEKVTDKTGKSTDKSEEKHDAVLQEGQHSGANYIISVDNKKKEYTPAVLLSSEVKVEDAFDEVAKDCFDYGTEIRKLMIEYYSIESSVLLTDAEKEEEKAKYAFYINGNIFTATYTSSKVDEEIKGNVVVGEEVKEEVVSKKTTEISKKYQVDFTADKPIYRLSESEKEKVSHVLAYENSAAGDVEEESELTVKEVVADMKAKVELKAADVSKYAAVGFDGYLE